MYRVETKTIDQLRGYWYEEATLPENQSCTSSDGRHHWCGSIPLDALIQNYLNEHIPASWSLVTLQIRDKRTHFVWSVPDGPENATTTTP